ncbi:MAG: hypothetical protein ACRDXB_21235 [Actinomycetes bacterium]
MYEMYPEWGPSHLRDKDDRQNAGENAIDLRDNGGERPDDN